MGAMVDVSSEIRECIDKIFVNENVGEYEIAYCGTNEKGEGYIGDIMFVKVSTKNGKPREYNLVLKLGKKGVELRKKFPIRLAFEREIHMYKNVFPAYQQFLTNRNVKPLDFLPKCFGTVISDDREVIVLENLKKLSYDVRGRKCTFDIDHLKLTMQSYGKLHATSFALAKQDPEQFRALSNLPSNVFAIISETESFRSILDRAEDNIVELLRNHDELELLQKFKDKVGGRVVQIFQDLVTERLEPSVIIHGDSWSNNFMFKYENEDKKCPSAVVMLDFQVSQVVSPARDLSYHIFSVMSEDVVKNLKSILDIYYDSLSNHLRELDCDPDQVFPYSTLIEHFNRYRPFGVIMACMGIPVMMSETSDVPDLENFGANISKLEGENKAMMENRIINVLRCGLQFEF